MGVVLSVEYNEVVMGTNTLVQVNLSKGQDETGCVPIGVSCRWSANANDNYAPERCEVFYDDNAGTARLNVQRKTGTDGLIVGVFTVEWDQTKVNVQQGTWSLSDSQDNNTATITSVDQTKAFVIHNTKEGATTSADPNGTDDYLTNIRFTSNTQLTITREHVLGSGLGSLTGRYFVVECIGTEFSVVVAQCVLASTGTTNDQTIGAVVMAKTFLIGSPMPGEGGPSNRDHGAWYHLDSTTVVNLSRLGGGAVSGTYDRSDIYVIECANTEWDVQRFEPNFGTAENEDNTTINSVDTAKTAVLSGCHGGGGSHPHHSSSSAGIRDDYMTGLDLSTATNVRARKRAATESLTAFYKFETAEFEIDAVGGANPKGPLGMPLHGPLGGPIGA